MSFKLLFTDQAATDLAKLTNSKRLKTIKKALGYSETNPQHPSLKTHKFSSLVGPTGEEVFEAYAENKTPATFRIFWYYGPTKNKIIITAITAHP